MKTKHITAAVAFALTFGLSVLLIGVPERNFARQPFEVQADNETAQQISFLLQEDDDNGREMEANFQMLSSPVEAADAVNQYVSESEAIDDTNLPADFRFAWQAHMKAWRAHADFLQHANLSNQKMTKCEFRRATENQNREITRTWLNVLKAAKRYDAIIPPNAY